MNPPQLYHDDTLLVSYPKSGNTWMRFILANLLAKPGSEIDFHNALEYIPDDSFSELNRFPRPRVIKSHEPHRDQPSAVVYIVRDPRDVYVSYFEYLRKKLPPEITFAAFLRKPDLYPCRWHTHVQSWLDQPSVRVLVRYEEMLSDCFGVMKRVLEAIPQISASDDLLREAIKASSFENMQKIEEVKGRPFRSETDRLAATV
ncbi:MAG: sulfotransferase domain-containing protein, partial [Opitutus sp.]